MKDAYYGDADDSSCGRKVDIRLPGKGNSSSHGARPVHQIILMIKWIRTSRLSIKLSLSSTLTVEEEARAEAPDHGRRHCPPEKEFFIDNLLVRIHLIIDMILVDRPCAMGA